MKILNRIGVWFAYHPRLAAGANLVSYPIVVAVVHVYVFVSEMWKQARWELEDLDYVGDVKDAYREWPQYVFQTCEEIRAGYTIKGEKK